MRRLGRPNLERLERIGRTAIELGWQAYLVGGVVRDLLLRRPTKDLDLVVVGDARRLAREIARAEGGVYREHRAFGTASVAFEDGVRLDLATARRESYRRPAALPDVSPSDLSDDLERRDFTINSMALELAPSELGRIVDPLEGQADLRRSVIRTLHARSFIDDPTRAFRAVRFAIRLGCQIEQSTAANLRQAVRSGVFDRLSGARVQRELSLLFDERDWIDLGRSLRRFGLLRAVHPCLRPTRTEEARLERAESWAEWYASIDHSASLERWVLALASLTLTRTAEERDALVARLRPRRRDSRELLESAVASRAILETLRATGHPRPNRTGDGSKRTYRAAT
jgi:tRNA nucleotidyltransferase (CCA-adding enzyme)